jgi:hypothetical protein
VILSQASAYVKWREANLLLDKAEGTEDVKAATDLVKKARDLMQEASADYKNAEVAASEAESITKEVTSEQQQQNTGAVAEVSETKNNESNDTEIQTTTSGQQAQTGGLPESGRIRGGVGLVDGASGADTGTGNQTTSQQPNIQQGNGNVSGEPDGNTQRSYGVVHTEIPIAGRTNQRAVAHKEKSEQGKPVSTAYVVHYSPLRVAQILLTFSIF